jgi:hypothetical protein
MTVRRKRIAVIPGKSRSCFVSYACNTNTYFCTTLYHPRSPGIVFLSYAFRITVSFKYILGITVFMRDVITIRGERGLWLDFIHKAKKEKKKAWDVLSPFLRKYVSAEEETRILLILFPKDLVEQLLTKDNPDDFIKEAIKQHLGRDR